MPRLPGFQELGQLRFFGWRQDRVQLDELVSAALNAPAAQSQPRSTTGIRRDCQAHWSLDRRYFQRGAEDCLLQCHRQLHDNVVALAPEHRVWRHRDFHQGVPWRAIANANINAEWDGVQSWQTTYSNTLEKFFEGQGVQTYVSRYHLDGTPLTSGQNTYEPAHAQGLVAMNAASAISATDKDSVDFVRDLWNTAVPSGQARYYDGMLYLMSLMHLGGEFRILEPKQRESITTLLSQGAQ